MAVHGSLRRLNLYTLRAVLQWLTIPSGSFPVLSQVVA